MMGHIEVGSCDQQKGSDEEGDADDGPRIAETLSHYQVIRGTGAAVTVRQLRSEGLSFQLWPAANAMGLYIEQEYGETGMSVIDARPPQLQRDLAHWYSSVAVPERNPVRGDSFSIKGLDNKLFLDDRICSVNDSSVGLFSILERNGTQRTDSNDKPETWFVQDIDRSLAGRGNYQIDQVFTNFVLHDEVPSVADSNVSLCNGFERNGRHRSDSNGGSEARILQDIERPCANADIENRMDQCFANFEANHRQEKNTSDRNGAHVVDKMEIPLSVSTDSSNNVHFSMRRMRVLELGSGTEMVGIVAACLGADVVLTDLPHVIPNISYNLDLNRSVVEAAGGSVEARVLRWGVEEDVKALGEQSFDLILASDCVYHDTSYKPFLQTLNWLIALDTDHTNHSMETQKPTIHKGVSALITPLQETDLLPAQLLGPAVCLSPLSKRSMPVADAIDSEINASERASQIETGRRSVNNNKPELSSETKERSERRGGGNESVILLGHVRRWKKDSHFFRMAAKCFDVDVVYRHPPEDNERIGPLVYRLNAKLNRKTSSSRSRSSSASIRSLPWCSPSRP